MAAFTVYQGDTPCPVRERTLGDDECFTGTTKLENVAITVWYPPKTPQNHPQKWSKKLGLGTGVEPFWYAAEPACKEESNTTEHRP